jgi:outer membrane protein OmpA-like peptidoglycan-associated protein
MKNMHIFAVTALLATFAITGCTSKPVVKGANSSALAGANGANGTNGANSTGLGADGDLNSNGLNGNGLNGNSAQDAVHRALLARVVHFDLDSSDLAQSDFAVLNAHASYLAQNGAAHVTLTLTPMNVARVNTTWHSVNAVPNQFRLISSPTVHILIKLMW